MSPQPTSRMVVHADDLGETAEITRGILECIDAGRVTSTSIMANMPATETAILEAAARGRSASFGVHLVLCEGRPLTDVPSLTATDGEFHPKRSLGLRGLSGRLDLDDVERELRAQIARIRDGGVQISHFDSHKHLHQLPGVRGVVARLAREFGVERIRCTLEEGWRPGHLGLSASISRSIRIYLASRAAEEFRREGLRHPGRMVDLRELLATENRERRLQMLRRPEVFTEMVCHPGTEQADLDKPGSCERFAESTFLTSAEFGELVDAAQVRLTTFWEC